MSIIKKEDLKKMKREERLEKLKELREMLMKGNIGTNKANSKTKEIKKTIARILTLERNKEVMKKE